MSGLKIGKSDLLASRENSLAEFRQSGIRPFGKFNKKDVFAWINPNMDELLSTVNAFAYRVIWFANRKEIDALCEKNIDFSKFERIICIDNASFQKEQLFRANITQIACKDFETALSFTKMEPENSNVMLFTFSGSSNMVNYEQLKEFLI